MSHAKRKQMIDRDHARLSVSKQCSAVGIARGCVYYQPKAPSPQNLALMKRMDELFMSYPFYGSRQMVAHLKREGTMVGRGRVRRLMRLMGLQAIYQKPRTSTPNPAHKIYPYLLRNMKIERANHVWCTDITYIPMQNGFLYLVVVMDWATRHVLSWRLSNTLEASFCVEALEEALQTYGAPKIFNTDQGAQFTSLAFTGVLREAGVQISMDGRGRYLESEACPLGITFSLNACGAASNTKLSTSPK
jgi:putative transposase